MDITQILSLFKSQQSIQNTESNNEPSHPIDQNQNGSTDGIMSSIPVETEATPMVVDSAGINIPTGMSLAAIDPALIAEVRQEFLSTQQQQYSTEEFYDPQPANDFYDPQSANGFYETQPVEDYYHQQPSEDSLDFLLDSLRSATQVTPQVLVALGRMCKETDLLSVLRECQQAQHRIEEELFRKRQEVESSHQKSRDALFAQELVGKTPDYEVLEKKSQAELKKIDIHVLRQMDSQLRIQQDRLAKLKVPFFKQTLDPAEIQMQHKILSILLDMINDE
ncbi:hypothetical protein BDA99DRAFT_491476 [Phascolomyces articulosus]|uniref:Uncharacterized protein n=1 Tax=Phascolomyces articulosus TaxID=60185 RepID=A0AAD5PK22_9FUNG|nr:hypothetical protein BDA99DRAFT_491476 [Phascolomyces articulosus]